MILPSLMIIIVAYIAYLTYKSDMGVLFKLVVFPSLVALSFMMYVNYTNHLGAPIQGQPIEKFIYIHHRVTDQGKSIELWAYTKSKNDRLYVFPYDRKKEKQLRDAEKNSKQGLVPIGQSASQGSFMFSYGSNEQLMGHDIPKQKGN